MQSNTSDQLHANVVSSAATVKSSAEEKAVNNLSLNQWCFAVKLHTLFQMISLFTLNIKIQTLTVNMSSFTNPAKNNK